MGGGFGKDFAGGFEAGGAGIGGLGYCMGGLGMGGFGGVVGIFGVGGFRLAGDGGFGGN